jgi:hypothetical protein
MLGILFAIRFGYLLLQGSRVMWLLSIALLTLSVILYAASGGLWWLCILAALQLGLLIVPASWVYFQHGTQEI